jgi:hypothetical protein
MTPLQQQSQIVTQVRRQREAITDDLPIYGSLIGYCIFLKLCQCEVRGQHPRLKDIHLEIGRSQGGVRRLIRSLLVDGWITITKSDGDQRNRYVVSTPRLKSAISTYLQAAHAGD